MIFSPTVERKASAKGASVAGANPYGMPRWSTAELARMENEFTAKGFVLPQPKINPLPQSKGDDGPASHEIRRYIRESSNAAAIFWSQPAYLGALAAMVAVVKEKAGDKRFEGVSKDPYYKSYAEALLRITQDAKGSPQDEARFHRELCDLYNRSLQIAKASDAKYGTEFVSSKGVLSRRDKYEKVSLPPVPFSLREYRDRHVLTVDREGSKTIKDAGNVNFRESLSFFIKHINKGSDPEERMGIAFGVALRMTWDMIQGKPYLNSLSRKQVARIAVTTQMASAAQAVANGSPPPVEQSVSGNQRVEEMPQRLVQSIPLPSDQTPPPPQPSPEVQHQTQAQP